MCQTFMKKKKWKTSVVNYPNSKQWNRLTNIRIRLLIRYERQNGELAIPSNRNAFLPISKRRNGELAVPTSRNAIFPLHVEEINQFTIVQSEASLDEVKKQLQIFIKVGSFRAYQATWNLTAKLTQNQSKFPLHNVLSLQLTGCAGWK